MRRSPQIGRGGTDLPHKYELLGPLAGWGDSTVWAARDVGANRPVMAKLLPPSLGTAEFVRSMREKIQYANFGLFHPDVVRTITCDLLETGPTCLLVMERVEGETLGDRLRRTGPMSPDEAVTFVGHVAHVIGSGRQVGVSHGAVNTEGIMVTPEGGIKVLYFGLAYSAWTVARLPAHRVVGRPASCLSPEQAEGKRPTTLSDVYALAAVLYELLMGLPPPRKEAEVARILHDGPLTGREWEHVAQACTVALSRWPLARPGSALALAALFHESGASQRPVAAARAREKPVLPARERTPVREGPLLFLQEPALDPTSSRLSRSEVSEITFQEPAADLTTVPSLPAEGRRASVPNNSTPAVSPVPPAVQPPSTGAPISDRILPPPTARERAPERRRYERLLLPVALLALTVGLVVLVRTQSPAGRATGLPPATAEPSGPVAPPSPEPTASSEEPRATVPDLEGMTVSEAARELKRIGLLLADIEPVAGEPGKVVRSEPTWGDSIRQGASVTLFVGAPPDRLEE